MAAAKEVCTHTDCFTCPYEDCISNVEVEPDRKRRGRKPLPPEEKKKRISARNHDYYSKNKFKWHKSYIEQSKDTVKQRYKKA